MAIRMRRGNNADYDETKMKSGEFAIAQDAEKVYVSFNDGHASSIALNGKPISPTTIELGGASSGHGGYIDFHSDASADYTTRLVEYNPGDLVLLSPSAPGTHRVLTQLNKPSGEYTGSGATGKTVNFGGFNHLGNLLTITSSKGYIVIVGIWGAFALEVSSGAGGIFYGFRSTELRIDNGVLYIETTHDAVNADGIKYYYHLL